MGHITIDEVIDIPRVKLAMIWAMVEFVYRLVQIRAVCKRKTINTLALYIPFLWKKRKTIGGPKKAPNIIIFHAEK
jgi:hypothetical protein